MRNKGFTLIELVIVIVILGILAATAAPKFIDLSGDARAAVVKGVEGSINSSVDMMHAKALIAGETGSSPAAISAAGQTITLVDGGWPAAASLASLLEVDGDISSSVSAEVATFFHSGRTGTGTDCAVVYTATSTDVNTRPTVTNTETGC